MLPHSLISRNQLVQYAQANSCQCKGYVKLANYYLHVLEYKHLVILNCNALVCFCPDMTVNVRVCTMSILQHDIFVFIYINMKVCFYL